MADGTISAQSAISEAQLARARAFGIDEQTLALMLADGIELPPTEDEITWSDGMPMDSERQALQMDLLFEPLRLHVAGGNVYVGKNQTVWYSSVQALNRDFLGPDVYVVLDVSPHERKGWAIWREGKAPDVALEILSPSTADRDRGEKKRIYQENIGVREYFWYDPATGERAGFRLYGREYVPIELDAEGRLPCPVLGLALVQWDGIYMQRSGPWLRWATPTGEILPTEAEAERQRAEAAKREAEAERQRAVAAEQEIDVERQRAEAERHRAEAERQRAETAEREADHARRQRAEMEAELARYRRRFGELPQ